MSIAPETLAPFSACVNRLQRNFTRLDEPSMTPFWAAVIVAGYCHDDALAAFGGFDFDDISDENGLRQLERLEQCIRAGKHRKPKLNVPPELVSMLGARGVKTSELRTEADFWNAAETMFAGAIKRENNLNKLLQQMKAIPKKERKLLADANLKRLPVQWLSSSAAHARKLQ